MAFFIRYITKLNLLYSIIFSFLLKGYSCNSNPPITGPESTEKKDSERLEKEYNKAHTKNMILEAKVHELEKEKKQNHNQIISLNSEIEIHKNKNSLLLQQNQTLSTELLSEKAKNNSNPKP